MIDTLSTETVDTPVGQYVIEFRDDDTPEQPHDEGFSLYKADSDNRIGVEQGADDLPHDVIATIDASRSRYGAYGYQRRSGAAIVRYLTLLGKKGVTLVTDDYGVDTPTTDRFDTVHGVAWAPDDAEKPFDYVAGNLAEWHAWAEGDVFGYTVTAPNGDEIDACWGFYGYVEQRDYVMAEARSAIDYDVEQRSAAANLVGAGFIGII